MVMLCARLTTAQSGWHEVRSPNFIIYTNVGERSARRVASDLERIRQVLQVALPTARNSDHLPLGVIAVKQQRDLRRLLPGFDRDVGGLFRSGANGPQVAFVAGSGSRYQNFGLGTLYHEFFHYLVALNGPGIPSWLNEGLASFWDQTEIRDDRIIVGQPDQLYVRTLREGHRFPMEEMLRGPRRALNSRLTYLLYAQRWALAHYLMLGEGGAHQEKLMNYIALVRAGGDVVEAAETAFGDFEPLKEIFNVYGRQKKLFDYITIPLDPNGDDAELRVRTLPDADTYAIRARFIVDGSRPEEAEPLIQNALKRVPQQAIALEAQAIVDLRRDDRESARSWIQRAIATGQASPSAYLLHANVLPGPEGREEALLRAIMMDRGLASAYEALAFHYAEVDPSYGRALAMTREAAERDPSSAQRRLLVARALRKMGSFDESVKEAGHAVRLALGSHTWESNNVCWFGSLGGLAAEVMPACEAAVSLYPDATSYLDTRGLARALTGDTSGAIADFQGFVDAGGKDEEALAERRRWIEALQQGRDPFDDEALAELLGKPF